MKTCLIVDDSAVVRGVLRRIIQDMGYTCIESGDGEGAYDICRAQMPDVVVVDWNMPAMNGLEFLKKLRKTAGGQAPRVIFCSSESEFKKIQRVMEAGADEYVMKPFDRSIIRSKFLQLGLAEA